MAAAVADYQPEAIAKSKIKKEVEAEPDAKAGKDAGYFKRGKGGLYTGGFCRREREPDR